MSNINNHSPRDLPDIFEFVLVTTGNAAAQYALVTGVFSTGVIEVRYGPFSEAVSVSPPFWKRITSHGAIR